MSIKNGKGVYNSGVLTQEQIGQIGEYCKEKPVEVVYLFGSQADGTARPDSDYDFGVLFDDKLSSGERFDLKLDLMDFFGGVTHAGNKVDVVDLNSAPIRFQYEAIKCRRDIFVRSRRVRDNFEYGTLVRYGDEMFFMKQVLRDRTRYMAKYGFQ